MGGILLPTTAQTKPQGGEVVAVGEGRTVGKNKVEISVKVISFHLLLVGYLCGFLVSEVGYICGYIDWNANCILQICWDRGGIQWSKASHIEGR